MPMTRYEIRNEYSLADPELYRAADKDDPEALLEGVAMAGIVGVLRQLGDLAEFAAEIFHDLHEEVMATAARGHGLMIRVQQLETEVPSIEKAFLSQTDHSQFFYNAGVEWHPNLQLDQNLVTQGDLPRFVMDSYEECRGPPRLFLLDKFDVAGAGACLKRYTDPSFFKVENSAMTSADVQWEKKIRKAKKKGPRWRNGETPEVLLSHSKFHQLFLDKPVEDGVSNPAHRAKLKRRLNGFPFDSKTGKSYMGKVLKTPSPEYKMLQEITVSSPLRLPANDHNESDLEALEIRSVSPSRERVGRKRSPPPSGREQTVLNSLMHKANEVSTNDKICEVPNSYPNTVTDGFSSTLDEETCEKDVAVAGESKKEISLTGYQSDDLASETDNYVDAPSTMDSEMDTDSEWKVKNDFSSNYIKNHSLISVENEEHLHSQSSDSQSTGDLTMSDEGNDSSKKEISSFLSSDSPTTSAEIPQSEKMSAKEFPTADIPVIAIVDASCYKKIADEDFPVEYLAKHVVSDNTFPGNRPDSEHLNSILCSADSTPILLHSDSEGVVRKGWLSGPKSGETASTSDVNEKKTNPITESQCFPSVSDSKSLSGDGSPRSPSGDHLADEPNGESAPCMSNVHDVICHTADSSAAISADLLHKDEYDQKDVNQFERTSSTLKMWKVPSHSGIDTSEMISTKNSVPGKLDDEALKLLENLAPDYTDIAHNGDNITSVVSKGGELNDELDSEDLNVASDGNHFSCTVEPFVGCELEETSFANPETVDTEEHYATSSIDNQISSETLIISLGENCPDGTEASLDAHDTDAISEEEKAVNETPELGTLKSGEVMELQGTGIADDVTPNDVLASQSSLEKIEDPAAAEKDGFNPCRGTTGSEVTEISLSANLKSLNEVHVVLDESGSKTDQSETAVIASPVPIVSDNAIEDKVSLPVVVDKLVEEHIPCLKDSGLDELKNDKNRLSGSLWELGLLEEDTNYLPGSQSESSLVEEVDEREAAVSDLHNVFCCTFSNDYPRQEVSHTISNLHLDSKVECSLDFVDGTQIQSPLGQSGLNTDQESLQQSVEYQASDATFLPIDCNTEETMFRERIQLPPDTEETMFRERIQLPPDTEEMLLREKIQLPPDTEETMSGEKIQLPPDTEETMLPEKIQLPPDRIDQELLESGEVSSELSAQLPINKYRMLALHEDKGGNNSALSFSLVNYPPSISELPGLRNHDINVSGYPGDSSNLFSENNHINLDELPPLPPLPPVQWRMGKLQHASSIREGETKKHKELFPREISPATVPTGDISSSTEEMNHSLIQIVPETSSKEVCVECSSRNVEANSTHETIDLPPKSENEYWNPSSLEAEPMHETIDLPPKIENEQQDTSSLEANSIHDTFDLPPKTENEHWKSSSLEVEPMYETTDLPPKIENEQWPTSNLEAKSMHERIGLPTRMQNEQLHLIMPTSESEVTYPAEEDGVADGSRAVKLPRPRNPLIDDVVAHDRSTLRKVTERVGPQMQKADERDSLLEQIRAKSFNLKPAVASRPSTQGPKTNLKVAAILEKANAIRQALAGSDEDEDNWSDS